MPAQLTCPHCHKEFVAKPIGGRAQRGFKCPHCKLFVPADRATAPERVAPGQA
jgi:transposase